MKQLSTNFNLIEFMSKDGAPFPPELECNVIALAAQLQILRDHLGESVKVLSGYRSPAHNTKVKGAKGSLHLQAKAADLTVKSKTPAQLKSVILSLIKAGKMQNGGIGLYKGFLHYDIGPVRRW
jgi:uncharacterized protein YcbK (DUF882 family)